MPRGPDVLAVPPKPRQGERIYEVAVSGPEDAAEALVRVTSYVTRGFYPWAPRIVGKPVRVGQRWHFVARVP